MNYRAQLSKANTVHLVQHNHLNLDIPTSFVACEGDLSPKSSKQQIRLRTISKVFSVRNIFMYLDMNEI